MTSGDESERPIMFGRARLGQYRHVCAFFNTPDEEYGVLLPFIGDGFVYGEKAFHIVDPLLRVDHLKRLGAAGIDVEVAQRRGQLEVRNWEDAYLRGGRFDQDAMLSLVEEVLSQQTFPRTRLVAHMEWALQDRPGLNDLLEYEARVNYILPKYPDPVV